MSTIKKAAAAAVQSVTDDAAALMKEELDTVKRQLSQANRERKEFAEDLERQKQFEIDQLKAGQWKQFWMAFTLVACGFFGLGMMVGYVVAWA